MAVPIKEAVAKSSNLIRDHCASASDVLSSIQNISPDAFANGFSTLIGALIGAMLAYFLQRRFQKKIEQESAQVSGHRLMFSLLQQLNTLVLIQKDFVFDHIGDPGKFLSIPAGPPFDAKKNVLEAPDLAFLLNSKEGRAILYEFYIAQENYVEALSQWNLRSTLHLEKVQPALAGSTLQNGGEITEEELIKVLGAHIFGAMVTSTDNCIISLQRSFQKLFAVKSSALAYLVKRFDSTDFTDFSIPEDYGLSDEIPKNM